MNVTRSIAYGIVGRCKTEASQKPVPVHSILAEELTQWRDRCRYREPDDWVFANEHHRGRHPYWGQAIHWGQAILRGIIRPVAERIGNKKWIGWHTFCHTYSTLLRSVGTEFKAMQELMWHSSLRSTIDIYTQAVTPAKHAVLAAVLSLFFPPNRIARFNPRSKKRTSDKTAV
jgi:site-specific recombinase XerD